MALEGTHSFQSLDVLDPSQPHVFAVPTKRIDLGQDVLTFLTSKAYRDIMTFILQLNRSMFPSKVWEEGTQRVQTWPLNSDAVAFSEPVRRLRLLLWKLDSIIDEVPPDPGPRRFGNISFRKWCHTVGSRASALLDECLRAELLQAGWSGPDSATAKAELTAYLMGSFGSPQRLDYGTGHELSFVAFLASLWKLNSFTKTNPGVEERGIVLGVIEPYLELVRRLIKTYTLEPAGSHGVWGLDDHFFIPYIFGSAQLSPPIANSDNNPVEGSLPEAPEPVGVAKVEVVERERKNNLYFSAIGFIYDVKKGPFWEHSPMLYDISGIRDGWGKINKGMIKMYNAEVLSKFPVVQHFPFGSLFLWEPDPKAVVPRESAHVANQPKKRNEMAAPSAGRGFPGQGTKAPWTMAPRGDEYSPGVAVSAPLGPTMSDAASMRTGPRTTRAPWGGLDTARTPSPSVRPPPEKAPWTSHRREPETRM